MEPSDDTIQIERTCGQCYHWRKIEGGPVVRGVNGTDTGSYPPGLCFYNPPTVYLVQQMTPLGRPDNGTMNLRPVMAENTPACGSWCPSDIDPFAGLEVPEEPV